MTKARWIALGAATTLVVGLSVGFASAGGTEDAQPGARDRDRDRVCVQEPGECPLGGPVRDREREQSRDRERVCDPELREQMRERMRERMGWAPEGMPGPGMGPGMGSGMHGSGTGPGTGHPGMMSGT